MRHPTYFCNSEKENEGDKSAMMAKYNDYVNNNWKEKDNSELDNEFKSGHSDKVFAKLIGESLAIQNKF